MHPYNSREPPLINNSFPAITVPLVERAHHSSSSPPKPATPLYVNPPNTSLIANGTALRIMPLGASITYGYLSTDGNGYREDLLGLLRRGGNDNITYVGSRNNGTMIKNAVEGWPGYRIDQVMPKAAASVPKYLPNVVLLNVGTNDCVQNWNIDNTTKQSRLEPSLTANATIDVGDRLQALVEDVLEWSPGATVVMSTLIVNKVKSTNKRVGDANTQFRDVASSLRAAGRRVVLADMSTSAGGPNITTMADVTHPNDVGYALMANRWYVALQQASEEGLIVAPSEVDA
ncbi:family 3 carbohydrate esterase [Cryphonectria parasitica EP155]|uniref:Family 3 carbohydrate esterase n=1 Tax=Cryphonectria parasitica (strain ATCC 38755 / EP155) TaxID=660469 RepID=A0A9P4Y5C1_CRYP1|nr:family 3 carbohydrate esterase [Cryphonectria parasitica EP155]KAF3766823.1 family 3 carbohydrate esterase [Cryphonectria parasitica EP155]